MAAPSETWHDATAAPADPMATPRLLAAVACVMVLGLFCVAAQDRRRNAAHALRVKERREQQQLREREHGARRAEHELRSKGLAEVPEDFRYHDGEAVAKRARQRLLEGDAAGAAALCEEALALLPAPREPPPSKQHGGGGGSSDPRSSQREHVALERRASRDGELRLLLRELRDVQAQAREQIELDSQGASGSRSVSRSGSGERERGKDR